MIVLNIEPEFYSTTAVQKISKKFSYREIDNLKNFKKKKETYALITRLKYKIDENFLDNFENLKFILCNTTGIDHIDKDVCKKRNIKIISLANEKKFMKSVNSTAEFTFGLIISLIRKIPFAFNDVLKFNWKRNRFIGTDLKGLTLGIIGFGRNGSKIAKYSKAFGMKIQYFDRKKIKKKGYQKRNLNNLLKTSDIIVVTISLNTQTYNLINSKNFKFLKKEAFIINTSRNQIICEKSLLYALKKKLIAGAALDVIQNELNIKKNNNLINYAKKNNNLLITPHIGGANFDAWAITENKVVDKFLKLHEKL